MVNPNWYLTDTCIGIYWLIISLCSLIIGNYSLVKAVTWVAQDALDNIPQEKILFSVVLALLWQHCTGQNPMQCCQRGSRQHCTGKNPCLNTLGKTLHRSKLDAMLSERLQTLLHGKNPDMLS